MQAPINKPPLDAPQIPSLSVFVYFVSTRYFAAAWKSSKQFCLFAKRPPSCHFSPYSLNTENSNLKKKVNFVFLINALLMLDYARLYLQILFYVSTLFKCSVQHFYLGCGCKQTLKIVQKYYLIHSFEICSVNASVDSLI